MHIRATRSRACIWLALLAIAFLPLAAILPATTAAGPTPPTVPAAEAAQTDYRIYLPTLSRPGVQTTEQLIDAARSSGAISAETALTYHVFALFDDARLPAQYRGAPSIAHDSLLLNSVIAEWPDLSASARAVLQPFLIPPIYRGSWWHERHKPAPAALQGQVEEIVTPDDLDRDEWSFIDSKNGKVKIWWQSQRYPEDRVKARLLADAVDAPIWTALVALMGREPLPDAGLITGYYGGDERLDVALIDISRSATMGLNLSRCDTNPAFILFNRTADRTELVHELMHAFQLSYDVAVGCPANEYRWLMESTAEWSKDYVYPHDNTEHHFAPQYLDYTELSLDTKNDKHEYGAYLFPLYLVRKYNQPAIVRKMWDNTTRLDGLEAVNAAIPGGFAERWPEFALYAWNGPLAPYNGFQQWDQLASRPWAWTEPPSKAPTAVALGSKPDMRLPLTSEVEHLAIEYYHMTFPDSNARTVTFYNGFDFKLTEQSFRTGNFEANTLMWEPVEAEARRGGNIQAFVKIGGQWQYQDWTNQPFKSFCRDQRAERLEELVVIVSNSEHDPNHLLQASGLPSTLTASNIGCWRYSGNASYKGDVQIDFVIASLHKSGETSAGNVIWQREPLAVETWNDASYVGVSQFRPVAGSVTTAWSGEGTCLENSGTYRKAGTGVPDAESDTLEIVAHSVGGEDHRGYAGDGSSQSPVPVVGSGCMDGIFSDTESIDEWFHVRAFWDKRVGGAGLLLGSNSNTTPGLGTISSTWSFSPMSE